MNEVTLDWYELMLATACGGLREFEAQRLGAQHDPPLDANGRGETNHVVGACAELAVAKFLHSYWFAGINCFGEPDVWPNVEVRYTFKKDGGLFVRQRDKDDRPYVLVRGAIPRFEIVGWIMGRDAKQECWYRVTHRGPCYIVSASVLCTEFPLRPKFNGE